MTKEQYKQKVEAIKEQISVKEKEIKDVRDQYIEANKPFDKDVEVEITLYSGRKVKGSIHTYGILGDGNVHITAYKSDGKLKYISAPNQNVIRL